MTIYRITENSITPIQRSTFGQQGLRERQDLQAMLKHNIQIISPDTLVVAEEFGEWEDSRRRIDLLGIDRGANLVVIELKRTEDGGHMELQAIRYAAMISSLTFDKLVAIYSKYLAANEIEEDATENLLEFLEWNEPDEDQFGQEVKIVLASAEFSKELTGSVMWLNEFGLNIRCVRMHPYNDNGETILDIQTVIPIPEATDYQVRIQEKKAKERASRRSNRDLTKFDVSIAGKNFEALSKRWLVFHVISGIIGSGGSPEKILEAFSWRRNRVFKIFEGECDEEKVHALLMAEDPGGKVPRTKRFFSNEGEFFIVDGKTYILSNQWGNRTVEAVEKLAGLFPKLGIEVRPAS